MLARLTFPKQLGSRRDLCSGVGIHCRLGRTVNTLLCHVVSFTLSLGSTKSTTCFCLCLQISGVEVSKKIRSTRSISNFNCIVYSYPKIGTCSIAPILCFIVDCHSVLSSLCIHLRWEHPFVSFSPNALRLPARRVNRHLALLTSIQLVMVGTSLSLFIDIWYGVFCTNEGSRMNWITKSCAVFCLQTLINWMMWAQFLHWLDWGESIYDISQPGDWHILV